MTEPVAACDAHRALVGAALGPDPTDEVLERYAREAAECPACRRALAARLNVHPIVLERAARGPGLEEPAGMRDLLDAIDAPPRRRWPWAVGGAVAAAAVAAAIAWAVRPAIPPAPAPIAPPPAEVAEVAPAPEPSAPAAPALPPPVVSRPVAPVPRRLPGAPVPLPEAAADDAVALAEPADDWPAPPFEDLRGGRPKTAETPIRAVQLVLSGGRRVGERAELTVVASADTALAVCVTGPERGVVWRGGVPAGRTDLTRGGRPQSFVFAAPGIYRFAVSTSDMDRCTRPVHVVEVEVAG